MRFACLLFEDVTALDLVGPLEVLGNLPEAEFVFVSAKPGPVVAERTGMALGPTRKFSQVDAADALIVPGGTGTRRLIEDQPTLEWLKEIDRTTDLTASICTGSLLLAAAGLLTGRSATTHWAEIEQLERLGANAVRERVVRDGKYVTAAGVSAGIDMALTLVQQLFGDDLAQAIQLGIEYDPDPPFDVGSPKKAPEELVALVRAAATAHDAPSQSRE